MEWKVKTYETADGDQPVDDFIKKQQPQAQSKIIHNVRLLLQYGNLLGLRHSKALGDGVYELRIRGKEELRILYCFGGDRTVCLLHAFKKQTMKIPQKELDIAQKRMRGLTSL